MSYCVRALAMASFGAMLLFLGIELIPNASGTEYRGLALLNAVGVGPREAVENVVGGASGGCNCDTDGSSVKCPPQDGFTCDKNFSGCSTKTKAIKTCVHGGNYNYCGGTSCKVSDVQYCTGGC